MNVITTISNEIFRVTIEGTEYQIDGVVEYILENGMNQFKFHMYEVVDLGECFELKRMGVKYYEFEAWNNDYIESHVPNSKMVKYTKEVIEKLAKIALK